MLRAAAEPLTMDAGASAACFHCGLPVASGRTRRLIDGGWRSFCCAGCEAVAQTIVGQGLGEYYRFRTAPTGRLADADARFDGCDDLGFQASFVRDAPEGTREAPLILEGIRCSACSWLNERTLRQLPGVAAANVNYATRRAVVRWAPGTIKLSEILSAVARIGYQASPYDEARLERSHRSERRRALWRLFVAGFGMMQVMMYAVPAYIAGDGTMAADVAQLLRWASLLLTLPVVGYAAQPFFAGAWRALQAGRLGMDVPVALGIAIAFGASVWATLRGAGEVYYDSIAMFVFLLLGGRYLELEARHRAAAALSHLARLAPAFAERLPGFPASLATDRVAAASLRPGDMLLVKPGETIAADGTVVRGRGAVAEAILTGESAPRTKEPGHLLIGGSVNLSEPLIVRVERVGADTVLAGIVRLAERAVAQRQPLVELADRYAHWFVLAVLVAAAATAIVWLQLDPSRALWVTNDGLVVDDYYKQGLAINQVLDREARARTLAIRAVLTFNPERTRVRLQLSADGPLPDRVMLRLAHPTRAGEDQTIALAAVAGGLFEGGMQPPSSGRWHVLLEDGAATWRLSASWKTEAPAVALGASPG